MEFDNEEDLNEALLGLLQNEEELEEGKGLLQ